MIFFDRSFEIAVNQENIDEVAKMEKRKLASVQYVHHITPIDGADVTELLGIKKWEVEERVRC